MKVVRLIKMYLNETYSKVRIAKNMMNFFTQWSEARRCFIAILFNFALKYAIRKVQGN